MKKNVSIIDEIIQNCDAEEWGIGMVMDQILNMQIYFRGERGRWARVFFQNLTQDADRFKTLIQKGETKAAAELGIIIGLRLAAGVAKLERSHGGGPKVSEIWSVLRKLYKENPSQTIKQIIKEGKKQFAKQGKACLLTDGTLEKHFKKQVKDVVPT